MRRFGFRQVLIVNGLLTAASMAACTLLTPHTPHLLIVPVLFISGAFRSMQFTSLSALQFADVPPEYMTGASTLASMVSQLMMGMSAAFAAFALNISAQIVSGHQARK
ncbi:hypothetical protein [Acidocella sp.]|uniref:hypothetical protein n=1 Tax=Acidocella sp. TaxID=50710 RepID=UPI002610A771|nr:hypothetical protein [Acidocella sp.]MDD2795734.1 hypothetical protein [Acidocella sp.]